MKIRYLIFGLVFVLVVMLGYWLASTAMPRAVARGNPSQVSHLLRQGGIDDEPAPRFRRGERLSLRGDFGAARVGALEGQRVVVFKDQAALKRFLDQMGDRVRLLGRLDALNALRIGFADYDDLLALLNGDEQQSLIFPVQAPFPNEGTVQAGAVALKNHLLDWLGITGDNSDWGKGVLIAILDTGVTANPAFNSNIRSINLVDLPADPTKQNGHGTGGGFDDPWQQFPHPRRGARADIISIRIANDNGQSDSFSWPRASSPRPMPVPG